MYTNTSAENLLKQTVFDVKRSGPLVRTMLAAFLFAVAATPTRAITIYTSRTAWELANLRTVITEDLESEIVGGYLTPYTTAHGITLESLGIQHGFQITEQEVFEITGKTIHHRDFSFDDPNDSNGRVVGAGISYSLGDSFFGVAFDWYHHPSDSWEVKVDGETLLTLRSGFGGFFGVTDPEGISSFVLSSSSFVQGGIFVDNIRLVVPEPSTFGLAAMFALGPIILMARSIEPRWV